MDSNSAKHNLAHSYSLPITVQELGSPGNDPVDYVDNPLATTLSLPMNYGPFFTGLEKLGMNIASLYANESGAVVSPNNIITTPSASLANLIVFFVMIGPGDHVIVQYPTYPQLYSLPSCLGAEVKLVHLTRSASSNPQNPTGAIIAKSTLGKIVDLAQRHSIIIFSDEIYGMRSMAVIQIA